MSSNICGAGGDSWNAQYAFDFATGGGLAEALFGKVMGLPFDNVAHSGDSTEETMGLAMRTKIERIMPSKQYFLLTAGGDDFIGDPLPEYVLPNDGKTAPEDAVRWASFNTALDATANDYAALLDIRDKLAPDCLLLTQSYDVPPPEVMGEAVTLAGVIVAGPWISPTMNYLGWTKPADMSKIMRVMLAAFQARIQKLHDARPTNWVHTNTQGMLPPGSFANELHLYPAGCLLLAEQINANRIRYELLPPATIEPETA